MTEVSGIDELRHNPSEVMTIKAPDHLDFDQDPFDQEPFTSVVSGIYQKIPVLDLFEVKDSPPFRSYIREGIILGIGLKYASTADQLMSDKVNFRPGLYHAARKYGIQKDFQYLQLIIDGILLLREYPYLDEYIKAQTEDRRGRLAKISEDEYNAAPTESYPKWLENKVNRENKIKEFEITSTVGEIFDESQELVKKRKGGFARKNWEIKKAAEIVREKR